MSGPFRFNQQSAQSPLERAASPFSAAQQPVSYKTNVNRAKTRKWVEAKKNAYDGDDWGDYDEYDEYGVDETSQPEPAPLSNPRYYGQRPPYDTPSRSFTDPAQQAPLPKARKNSFDAGEEQRSFSASIPHPQQQQGYAQQPQYQQQPPPPLQTGGMGQDVIGSSPQNRDFSPSAMPQPLHTRLSTGPADLQSSPQNTQFPPRKSSIGQGNVPQGPIDFTPIAASPRERAGSQDKPLPFIRPADIYKRVEEERRRESMDSSRPNPDAILSSPTNDPKSPAADRRNLHPLETVGERKSEHLPDLNVGPHDSSDPQQPQYDNRVPSALKGIPTFDNDFWSSGPDLQAPASHAPVVSPSQDQGFRSVVDQAFTRSDDQRSVPPTPISKDSDSDLNRSNTGSTSGISPIMSRVPSSATSAMRNRNLGDGSTPVIAEEPLEAGTPVSRPTSGNFPQAPHAFQGHTRNLSNTSLPRSGLATPTRGDSPARSPAFGPQKTLPEPEAAQIATDSTDSPESMEGGLSGPHSDYAKREADIATAMLSSPVRAVPEFSAAEKQSQDAFLESHNAQSPIGDVLPRDRSESPSKGRVQALAGKFGEVSSSRRGSTQSNISRNSMQSWERSQDNSRAPSPTKGSPGKPSSPKKEFRPHLPGGWESYAITTPAPLDPTETDKGLGMERNQGPSELAPVAHVNQIESDRGRGAKKDDAPLALADVDLTPTTKKGQAAEVKTPSFDPILALKDAGAAMTESLRTTAGFGGSSEQEQEQEQGQEQQGRRSHGDVYMPRPLHMERASSAISSIPPTPPAKDTPESEFPPTPPLKEHPPELMSRPERPVMAQQLSTDPSADDQESDRLRKEIVASLSPLRMSRVPTADADRNSLRPDSKGADQASSILDSYYAELDRESRKNSNELDRNIPELAPLKSASSTQSALSQKPTALKRYSWEANSPSATPEKQTPAVVNDIVHAENVHSPTIERAVEEEQQQPQDPYFGPGHTFTVTKPEPLTDAELAARAVTPPLGSGLSLSSPPTREQTRSPGLHIVNSAVDPEAVDLPPRWSAEHSPQPPKEVGAGSPPLQLTEQQDTNPAVSAHTALTGSIEAPESSTVHEAEIKSPASPKSSTSDKPLGAREIATIGSAAERIATYNKTRDQWATTDHGLSDWITATFEADPSLATQSAQPPFPQPRPQSGTFRHKHTGSLAMLGKFTGSSNNQPSVGAYYEQYNSAAAQVPASSNSPTAGPSKTSSGFLGRTASHSIQTQQMQAKGKDLLHTAGVLSGKGMTSAKGLFAKGKSRFNRDKDSAHSREASKELEPSAITTAEGLDESKRPPADLVQLSEQYDESKDTGSLDSSKDLDDGNIPGAATYESPAKPLPHEYPISWPGTLLSTVNRTKDDKKQVEQLNVAPLPEDFAMQFSGEVSPLLRSSRASLQEVSDDETGLFDHAVDAHAQRPHWETETIGAGDVSDEENSALIAKDLQQCNSSHASDKDSQVEQPKYKARTIVANNTSDENDTLPKTSQLEADLLHTISGDKHVDQTSYDAKIIGVGDVSPTNDVMNVPAVEIASIQALDMQSALESKVVGADDVSPVSTRSSFYAATSSNRDNEHIHEDDFIEKRARPSVERFYTAGVGFDLEPVQPRAWRSDQNEDIAERPRVERFGTAQEEVQGSSELTIPKVRQPASLYATVATPEPVAAYKEYTGSSTSSSDDLLQVPVGKPEASTGALTPQRAERADAAMPTATRQISASQLQVVHAVEEYAASNSSLASWDQDSNAADVISEPDAAVEMRDDSDLVTPVAQVPRNAHHGQQADQAGNPNHNTSYAAPIFTVDDILGRLKHRNITCIKQRREVNAFDDTQDAAGLFQRQNEQSRRSADPGGTYISQRRADANNQT
ncbi:hypothetical protein N0V95_005804 [Ascochyta clinopodiicola]|nr:hypothetical protein N0V95_005804 [Ascochyta clinopodiicola]